MVPTDVQGELKHLYTAAGELLRHFWSCFPVNTPFLEEKVSNFHPIAGAVVARVHDNVSLFCVEGDQNEIKPREISDDQDFSFQGEDSASVLEYKCKSVSAT